MDAGVEVETKFFVLAFILFLFPPVLFVDGSQPIKVKWGKVFLPLQAGRHQVRCYTPYLWIFKMGDSSMIIDVGPGQVVQTKWSAPLLVFLKGKWSNLGIRGLSPADAQGIPPAIGSGAAMGGMPAMPQALSPQPIAAVAAVASAAAAPAAWQPDPSARHQLRYWDGQSWTPNVSDNGVTGTDPL